MASKTASQRARDRLRGGKDDAVSSRTTSDVPLEQPKRTRLANQTAAVQQDESEKHKAQLRQQVRQTIARIHKLKEDHEAVRARSNRDRSSASPDSRSREATPEYDPDNPFDDRRFERRQARQSSRTRRSESKGPTGLPSENVMGKSRSEGDVLHPAGTDSRTPKSGTQSSTISRAQRATRSARSSPERAIGARKSAASVFPSQQFSLVTREHKGQIDESRSVDSKGDLRASRVAVPQQTLMSRSNVPTTSAPSYTPGKGRQADVAENSSGPPQRSSPKATSRKSAGDHKTADPDPSHSLSHETSEALASLEASLARLKSLSPGSKEKLSASPDRQSKRPDPRRRRSLSPSKEMHESSRARTKVSERETPRVKASFLTRVEQTRQGALPMRNSDGDSKISTATKQVQVNSDLTPRAEATTQTKPVSRRHSLYSYTPPKRVNKEQQCGPGTNDDEAKEANASASSMVIGDESVDDLVRSHGTEEGGQNRQFLHGLKVLVDVRDQDGEDASAVWMEKLRSVGAKVYSKPPQPSRRRKSSAAAKQECSSDEAVAPALDCIVFKHGKPATLHYYRSQVDAGRQPVIVGVNWVLHCLRVGEKVEERDYLVEVGKHPLFAKRRPSMTPKRAPATPSENASKDGARELSELMAQKQKKDLQRAPARPSPLASRCWNLDASTSSSLSTATTTHNTTTVTTQSNLTSTSFT